MYLETKLTYLEPVVDFLFYFFLICFGNLLEDLDALVCLTPLSQPANRFLNKAGNSWIQFSTLDQWDFVLYQSYNGVMKIIAAWAKITTWNIFQSCSALWIVNKLDIICVIKSLNGNYQSIQGSTRPAIVDPKANPTLITKLRHRMLTLSITRGQHFKEINSYLV